MGHIANRARGIQCHSCGGHRTGVTNSRPRDGYVYRRRECSECGTPITTTEFQDDGSQAGQRLERLKSAVVGLTPDEFKMTFELIEFFHRNRGL